MTWQILRDKGACPAQVRRFFNLFPDGVEVTETSCTAVAEEFEWHWSAETFLPKELLEEYNSIRVNAWKEHAYRVENADFHFRAADISSNEYIVQQDISWKEFNRTLAKTFGRLASAITETN